MINRLITLFGFLLLIFAISSCVISDVFNILPVNLPTNTHSLFIDDICSPPCWFGLTPGISTTEDVIALFISDADRFLVNPKFTYSEGSTIPSSITEDFTPLLEGISFSFIWQTWERDDAMLSNRIEILNDMVIAIEVQLYEYITLRQTLEILGQPDYIFAEYDWASLDLIYTDQSIVVDLFIDVGIDCNMTTFLDDYTISHAYYYIPSNLAEVSEQIPANGLIPNDLWMEWQTNLSNTSCFDIVREAVHAHPFTPPLTPP